MQKLNKLIETYKIERPHTTPEEIVNLIREYLQIRILCLIFQSKFGAGISFMGGTCLRICYDLKRYSEDLDFALDNHKKEHHFSKMIQSAQRELELMNFKIDTNIHEEKTVQKAFIRFSGLYESLNIQASQNQKIHIKIEVDTNPVPLHEDERESFFVTRYGEIFPILKHTLPTLFAGKILAILYRPYARGRDYYDLIWYLTKKTPINLRYLAEGSSNPCFKDEKAVYLALKKKVSEVKPSLILKDIGRFLEDSDEIQWIDRYAELFDQLIQKNNDPQNLTP